MVHWWHGEFLLRLTAGCLCWVVPAGLPVSCWPCWGVCVAGREGIRKVHEGLTPPAPPQAALARGLCCITPSFHSSSIPSKTARSISLQRRWKPLIISLNRWFFCMRFPCLKLSHLLWCCRGRISWPSGHAARQFTSRVFPGAVGRAKAAAIRSVPSEGNAALINNTN